MNSIKNFRTAITIIFVLSFSVCDGQSTTEEEVLILGTWVAEGSNINDKWVFTSNGTLREYTNNSLDITYVWSILSTVNSGITSHYLEIVNTNDSTDMYNYEISIINEEMFVLIYQREDNMGLGKPAIYFRQ